MSVYIYEIPEKFLHLKGYKILSRSGTARRLSAAGLVLSLIFVSVKSFRADLQFSRIIF